MIARLGDRIRQAASSQVGADAAGGEQPGRRRSSCGPADIADVAAYTVTPDCRVSVNEAPVGAAE